MQRLIAAGIGGVLLSVVLMSSQTVGAANLAAAPNVEEIMQKVYKPKGLHKAVGKSLELADVDWAAVSTMTTDYAKLVGDLPKCKCPKGDAASWEKLTKQSAADSKALNDAVAKKDKTAALAVWGKLNKSCQACHDEHR